MNNIYRIFRISSNYTALIQALILMVLVSLSYCLVNLKFQSDEMQYSDPLPEILLGQTYVQKIDADNDGLDGISLLMATYARKNNSFVSISLSDSQGKAIREWKIDSSSINDNSYRTFNLDKRLDVSRGQTYFLTITTDASSGNGITVWTSSAGRGLSQNGQDLGKTLCYRLTYRHSLSYFLSPLSCLCAAFIFVVAYIIFTILFRLPEIRPQHAASRAGIHTEQGILKYLCYILIAYCVVIRCYLYIYHKDFWLDECLIANAIYDASWSDIFSGRLPNWQSCPLAFAMIAKLLSYATSYSPLVLYLLPSAAGIATAFLIYYFGIRLYGIRFAACCLAVYAVLSAPLYYSSEFKPYIFDFLFTVILFGSLFNDLRKQQACRVFLGKKYPLLFAASWLCSSTSIICSAAVGITIFFYLCNSRQFSFKALFLRLAKLYFPFAVFAGLYYFGFLRHGASEVMYEFWRNGFVPSDVRNIPVWVDQILKPVYYGLTTTVYSGNALSIALFWCAVFGLITLPRRSRYEFTALIVLLILVSALSVKFYPVGLPGGIVGSRLILYLLPVIVFLSALGVCSIIDIWCRLHGRYLVFINILVSAVMLLGTAQTGVYYFENRIHNEDSFQMYQTVSDSFNPASDLIVAYSAAEPSFRYWKIFNSKTDDLPYVSLPREKLLNLRDDLFEMIGRENCENKKRIFFLFTHREPSVTNNVAGHLKEHDLPFKEFKWAGTELLIAGLD